MRVRRLIVLAAMGAMGLAAVRAIRKQRALTDEADAWDTPPPPAPPVTAEAPAEAAAPAEEAAPIAEAAPAARIKGNIRSDGDRIYHMPGDPMFERTKAEQEFDTAEEAEAAGFRRAGTPKPEPGGPSER